MKKISDAAKMNVTGKNYDKNNALLKTLAVAAKNGNETAKVELCRKLEGFMVNLCKCAGFEPDYCMDAMSEAQLAVLKAVEKYEPEKGEFLPYVKIWIHGSLMNLKLMQGAVRLGRTDSQECLKLVKVKRALEQSHFGMVNHQMLAEALGWDEAKVVRLEGQAMTTVSLDEPHNLDYADDVETDGCQECDYGPVAKESTWGCEAEMKCCIEYAVKRKMTACLAQKRQGTLRKNDMAMLHDNANRVVRILCMHVGLDCEPMAPADIAQLEGVTAERIRQILREWQDVLEECAREVVWGVAPMCA